MLYSSCIHTIGKTPLVHISNMTQGLYGNLYAKAEFFNPAGSVKDRIGAAMIQDAENKGLITENTTIVEPTSGNTGIALAFICARNRYKLILTMPETMSIERQKLLTHFGAELVLTDGTKGMAGAISKANELVSTLPDAFMPDQFSNPANPEIHRQTTAVELIEASPSPIDIFISGVGTGGTITGVGSVLKKSNPNVKIIAVEPDASPVLSGGNPGPHKIQGIGAGFVPDVLETSIIDSIIQVSNDAAIETAKELAKQEGLLCGISSGAAVYAAMTVMKDEANKDKTIVTVLPSTGERYLSTDLFK